jgi:putative ATPase
VYRNVLAVDPVDLFSEQRRKALQAAQPLPVRMRPTTLDEFVGQEHFVGPGKLLRRLLQADRLTSAIFYGPPGTGKTTLARIIASHTKAAFEHLRATAAGVKDVREVLERAKNRLEANGQRTVLFLDEIHRFNRAQQDVLLDDVEQGVIILIGATTENPFFSVNAPLVSRSQVFQFEPLSSRHIRDLLLRALKDKENGLGNIQVEVTPDALDFLAEMSDGDARRALSGLEVAVLSQLQAEGTAGHATPAGAPPAGAQAGTLRVDRQAAAESIQRKALVYDAKGDAHYDHISAFIKSVRGSDPDAAIYWLARMLEAGEDPRFVARRIAILASEDIGNADPRGIQVAAAAYEITERIGMPECQLTLAQATIYLACAPKSNASAMAIWSAAEDVKGQRVVPVPRPLRDTHYPGAKRLQHGEGYQYPHDYDTGFVQQEYLGVDKTYYLPTGRGYERQMAEYLRKVRGDTAAGDAKQGPSAGGGPPA